MDDVFALCAMRTPKEGALEALDAILKAGMPANIKVNELREDSEFDKEAGLQHLICTYATPDRFELAGNMIDKLFEYGANWMLLDSENRTPGEIAYSLGKLDLYEKFVEAGFRSEILLQKFQSEDSDSELENQSMEGNIDQYLEADLAYDKHTLKTSKNDGVMMDWETPIMQRSAEVITKPGSTVLNIGFGMGIIDGFIQELKPEKHYIIEAHPGVLQRMRDDGWFQKENVIILEGTWKTILPKLIEGNVHFDGIYYDTFSEHYRDMLILFDYVVGLLNFEGTFSFFNGLGADRQVCYDVYKRVCQFNLKDYGLNLEFENMDVKLPDWKNVKFGYFKLNEYALPIVRFNDNLDEEEGELLDINQ